MNKIFEILIIDDTPQNLKLLIEILNKKEFQIRVFSSPEQSMKSIEIKIPDLILLDVNMPKITGFQFASFLKTNIAYKDIPIIFITASSSIEDKLKAFELGGVDYITKPFQIEEVLARVNAQLTIKQAKDALEETLNHTLQGSISLLTEILSFTNPEIFNKSVRLKTYTETLIKTLKLKNKWVYEIASMLSQLGCLSLPEHIIKKVLLNLPLSQEDTVIYEKYKEIGSMMIGKIPKLEMVSLILLQNYKKNCEEKTLTESEKFIVQTGSDILKFIIDYDNYKCKGLNDIEIETIMKKFKVEYNEKIMEGFFNELHLMGVNFIQKKLFIKELGKGMTLIEDIIDDNGMKVLAKDTILTENVLHLLEMYSKNHVINQQVLVSILG